MNILDELESHVKLGRRMYVGPISEHMGFLGYPMGTLPALIRVARAAEEIVKVDSEKTDMAWLAKRRQALTALEIALQQLRDLSADNLGGKE